ncbi:hypothetical protein [Actinosynnema sp. NPDC023587]|uniref:hypothetical protein n=1 Tax=Actinosynnema sp. NPDC023587 TaxID=3154695 RepID=UPI00340CA187
MAVSDAVRRSGSLLLRALAVGGFATTAWLLGTGAAAADGQNHPDEGPTTLDVVNVAVDQQRTATAELLEAIFTDHLTPALPGPVVISPVQVPSPIGADLPIQSAAPVTGPVAETVAETAEGPTSFTGGTANSGTGTRTGLIVNTVPAPVYEAKVAAKAAARQAALQTEAPAPVPDEVPVPVPTPVEAQLPVTTAPEPAPPPAPVPTPADEPAAEAPVTWENPEPAPAAPAPKQAPAPTGPTTASTSGHDNSNGHRGGVIASATSQAGLIAPAVWSVEQREDDRSPGSVPGLPSTSPD